jgi:mRNA interferase MazF
MTRGSVWWVEFDPSIGSEIHKTRPAVIVSNDKANQYLARVVVVPLTSNVPRLYPGEALITVKEIKNKAMSDQIMSADKSRLRNKIGVLSEDDMLALESAMKRFFELPYLMRSRIVPFIVEAGAFGRRHGTGKRSRRVVFRLFWTSRRSPMTRGRYE